MTLADERRIAEAATEGPWEERTDDADMLHVVHDSEYVSYVCTVGGKEAPNAESDAEFIATFNPAKVLDLLARLAAVEELHQPVETPGCDNPACCDTTPLCGKCVTPWPCDTIKAVRGE